MNTSRFPHLVAFLSLATAGLVGCADDTAAPATAADIRGRIDRLVPRYTVGEERIESAIPTVQLPQRAHVDQPWRPSDPSVGSLETSADLPLHMIRLWSNNNNVQNAPGAGLVSRGLVTPPQLQPLQRAPHDPAAWLNEHIFTDANDEGGGEFRIPTEAFCGADAVCAKRIAELRLGVIATPVGDDGLDLDIVTGDNRDVAASFTLSPDGADVSYDLAVAKGILAAHSGVKEASGVIDVHFRGFPDYTENKVRILEPVHVVIDRAPGADDVETLDLAAGEHVIGTTPAK